MPCFVAGTGTDALRVSQSAEDVPRQVPDFVLLYSSKVFDVILGPAAVERPFVQ